MPNHTVSRTMGPTLWGLLVVLALMWGGSYFFVAVGLKELPGLTIISGRTAIAAVILWLLVLVLGTTMPSDRRAWSAIVVMGIINNAVPFYLMVWAQSEIASGVAAILNAATPILTIIVAHFYTRDEKITPLTVAAVILGFAGVAVMIGGAALQSLGTHVLAHFAMIAMSLLYAISGVYGRRFATLGVDPIAVATGQVTVSALILLPLALIVDQPWTLPVPSLAVMGAVFGLALFSTSFGYVIYFRVLARAGATNLLLVSFMAPAATILLGFTVLGETLEPRHFAGLALIGIGLLLMDGRLVRRLTGGRRVQPG